MSISHRPVSLLATVLLAACAPAPPPAAEPEPVAVVATDSAPPPPPERTLEERWREPFAVEVSGSFPERPLRPPVVVVEEGAAEEAEPRPGAAFDSAAAPASVSAAEAEPEPARRPVASTRSHHVAAGDTLFGLARRYGVSVARIREVNDLTGDTIRVGQTLRIPVN